MTTLSLVAALLAASSAGAQAPGAEVHLNDASITVSLQSSGMQDAQHYWPELRLGVIGPTRAGDVVVAELRQGRRGLATLRCRLDADGGISRCTDPTLRLTATGELEIDLVYTSDLTGARVPLRTLRVHVERYDYFDRRDGRRALVRHHWQVRGDDLIGGSALELAPVQRDGFGFVRFHFWAARRDDFPRERVLRCSIDGQPLGENLAESVQQARAVGALERAEGGPEVSYAWQRFTVNTRLRHAPGSTEPYPAPYYTNIATRPGAWVCELRSEGVSVRSFHFHVEPDGSIRRHPEQEGPEGLRYPEGLFFVETRIPEPGRFDFSLQPVARETSMYGRPWRAREALAPMLETFPARAVGSSAPGSAGGRRAR